MKAEDILNNKIEREYERQISKVVDECFNLIKEKKDELRGYENKTIDVYHSKLNELIEETNTNYNGFHKNHMTLKRLLTSLFDDVEIDGKERIGKRIIKKVEEFFHNEENV